MIKLIDKENTAAADADFPFGSVRDKTLSVAGTKYNKSTMSDYFQFFEKMFSESGLVANGDLDNETNGFQLYEALKTIFKPYKTYNAKISQSSTSAPVVTVKGFNDLGSIVWTRTGVGVYRGTLVGAFSNSDTAFIYNSYIGIGTANDIEVEMSVASVDYIEIRTFNNDTPADAQITNFYFEIKNYD